MSATLELAPEVRELAETTGADLHLTCTQAGRLLSDLTVAIAEGTLYSLDGHTIKMPDGRHIVNGVALESAGLIVQQWHHGTLHLFGPDLVDGGDSVTYTITIEGP